MTLSRPKENVWISRIPRGTDYRDSLSICIPGRVPAALHTSVWWTINLSRCYHYFNSTLRLKTPLKSEVMEHLMDSMVTRDYNIRLVAQKKNKRKSLTIRKLTCDILLKLGKISKDDTLWNIFSVIGHSVFQYDNRYFWCSVI